MRKSGSAFRTISEVAEWLDVQTHVLRFWESKFPQIKPVKGAGGRRYYRPEDMLLIGGIKVMLYTDGLSIKEAKAQLKKDGIKTVSARSAPLPDGVAVAEKAPRKRAAPKAKSQELATAVAAPQAPMAQPVVAPQAPVQEPAQEQSAPAAAPAAKPAAKPKKTCRSHSAR